MALRLSLINSVSNYNCFAIAGRLLSSNRIQRLRHVDKVILTDDLTTFVAWHPKKDFSFEFSRPLPDENVDNNLSLKCTLTKNTFKNLHPEITRQELVRITHTSKHIWYPRSRDKRAKNTPMDRKYL
ncbi:39S ribosomal protein L42, mitochondrial [Ctenocephalides felis]|uniref:39S ribosomal protein L42, mitochondrial n=1 Tax=Ctenocephalides felis TaxID=7515 RepID=UPI000E6E55C8|nr:39S ribosomal protein L42, mitochondrial [Ctenocephalides felis]